MTLNRLIRARPILAGVLILTAALVGVIPSALGAPKRVHQGPPVVTGSGIAIVPSETDPHTLVIATQNAARFQKVWLYMLTAEKP